MAKKQSVLAKIITWIAQKAYERNQKKKKAALQTTVETAKLVANAASNAVAIAKANTVNITNRPTLKGATNTEATNKYQPFLMGRQLFTPYLHTQPRYTISGTNGEDMYVSLALECGFNNQVLRKINIDDERIYTFDEDTTTPQEGTYTSSNSTYPGTIEIAQDGNEFTDLTEINAKTISAVVNKNFTSEEYEVELDETAKDVEFGYTLPNGLYYKDSSGYLQALSVTLTFSYSLDGGTSWTSETVSLSDKITTYEPRYTWSHSFTLSDYETLNTNGETNIICKASCSYSIADDATTDFSAYLIYYQSTCFDKELSSSPAGVLDDSGSAGLVDCAIVQSRERALCTILGVRIKATYDDEKIGKINVITSGVARTWDGTEWSDTKVPTRNPAAWALEVMTSDKHRLSQFDDTELDLDSFGAFYEYCEDNDFYFDYTITSAEKKQNVIDSILAVTNATMMQDQQTAIYKICIDEAKDTAVAVYNPQNIITITNDKEFARPLDAVRIKYTNSYNDLFEEDTYIVLRQSDGVDVPLTYYSVIKDITVSGITTFDHIVKYGRRYMAEFKLRPKTTTIQVGKEAVTYSIFDKVLLQDDSLKIGTGHGVIKELEWSDTTLTTIVLDSTVTIESGVSYGLVVNAFTSSGASPLYIQVTGDEGDTDTLEVVSTVTSSDDLVPEVGNVVSFGTYDSTNLFEKITTPYLISGINHDADGLYTLTLVNYNEAIYDDGTIPDYCSNLSEKPSRVYSDIAAKTVTQAELDTTVEEVTSGGLAIGAPDTPTDVSAVAEESGIKLSCSLSVDGLKNSIAYLEWTITKADSTTATVYSDSYDAFYTFDRSVDGYPETTANGGSLDSWSVTVHAVNVYDKSSDETSAEYVDTDSYGTWLLSAPSVNSRVQDRTIFLTLSEATTASSTRYGDIRYRVSVKRYDDTDYYTPATTENPYPETSTTVTVYSADGETFYSDEEMTVEVTIPDNAKVIETTTENEYYYIEYTSGNEENYKASDAEVDGYVISSGSYNQTMPLEGQKYNNLMNTTYSFSVVAYNESGNVSEATIASVTALCTNIRDIVMANETAKSAFIETLSAITANIGVVTGGALGDSDSNHIALSTFVDENNNQWYKGDVFFGDSEQYFKVTPNVEDGEITDYTIELKANNISLTSSGLDFTSGTYIYDTNNTNLRLALSAGGITIQETSDSWSTYDVLGKVYIDEYSNLIITNAEDSSPLIGFSVDGASVYRFNGTSPDYDEDGTNSQSIVLDTTVAVTDSGLLSDCNVFPDDITTADISSSDTTVVAVSKADKIKVGDTYLLSDGTTEETYNSLASTDWGLTSTQVANGIFSEDL